MLGGVKPHQRSNHGQIFEELLRRTLNVDPRQRDSAETLVTWMETREEDAGERLAPNMISVTNRSASLASYQSTSGDSIQVRSIDSNTGSEETSPPAQVRSITSVTTMEENALASAM